MARKTTRLIRLALVVLGLALALLIALLAALHMLAYGREVQPRASAAPMFEVPLSAQPKRQRLGLDVRVVNLPRLVEWLQEVPGAQFEHFYDY